MIRTFFFSVIVYSVMALHASGQSSNEVPNDRLLIASSETKGGVGEKKRSIEQVRGVAVWQRSMKNFYCRFADDPIGNFFRLSREAFGNIFWDFIRMSIGGLSLIVPLIGLFSLRMRIMWFRKGFGVIRTIGVESFGRVVAVSDVKGEYIKISSLYREAVVTGLNESSGVFLVMGPAGAGKGFLIYAETRADVILSVQGEEWYDPNEKNPPVKEILKRRTRLLTRFFLPKKKVCIVLEWSPVHQLPSSDRMDAILADLTKYVAGHVSRTKIMFVVKVPAYYLIERESHAFPVNLLSCSECKELFEKYLPSAGWGENDVAECKAAIMRRAEALRVTVDRLLWIESFGRPRQIIGVARREHYGSLEAWKSLGDWWRSVYNSEDDTKNDWMAYLYVIALKGLVGDGFVNVGKIFNNSKSFKKNVRPAIWRLCAKQKPNLARFDPLLIFQDAFVRDEFLLSLGDMTGVPKVGGDPIRVFSFKDELQTAICEAFAEDVQNQDLCANIASAYLDMSARSPDLARRFVARHELVKKIEDVWGDDSPVSELYKSILFEPATLDSFMADVISRIGAVQISDCVQMFKTICEYCRTNMSADNYVNVIFCLLPAFEMSSLFADLWGVDFPFIAERFNSKEVNDVVRYRCAVVLCHAALAVDDSEMFVIRNLKFFHEWIEKQCDAIMRYGIGESRWEELRTMFKLSWTDTSEVCLVVSGLELNGMEHDVRTSWLLRFVHFMRNEGCDDLDVSMTEKVMNVIWHVVSETKASGCQRFLVTCCKYLNFISFDLDAVSGRSAWKKRILLLQQGIERWTECPTIAAYCFSRCCEDVRDALSKGYGVLVGGGVLWKMVYILREWQSGMEELRYSKALVDFAGVLRGFSDKSQARLLLNIWKEFSDRVKTFWLPRITSGNIDEALMCHRYFCLINRLSNVECVSSSERKALCYAISPSPRLFADGVHYNDSAKEVYEISSDVMSPADKFLLAAALVAGRLFEHPPRTRQESIAMAEQLIAGVRSGQDRKVDEGLVEKFRELCGRFEPLADLDMSEG